MSHVFILMDTFINAMLASNGLMTPRLVAFMLKSWVNSGLRLRLVMPSGAMSCLFSSHRWLILSKHFSISVQ